MLECRDACAQVHEHRQSREGLHPWKNVSLDSVQLGEASQHSKKLNDYLGHSLKFIFKKDLKPLHQVKLYYF